MTAWLAAVWRRSCRRSLPSPASAQTVRQQFVRLQSPRPPAWRGNRNASGSRAPGSDSICARAASPSATARGPIFESRRLMASSPISRQRRSSTSLRRQPVSASNRIAATASGHRFSCASSARPSRASSSASRNRATWLRGFFAMPRQGFEPRSRNPHSSARFIIARSISKARLAAPGLSLLAASNQAATSSGPMRSSGILPNEGRMRALR